MLKDKKASSFNTTKYDIVSKNLNDFKHGPGKKIFKNKFP